MSSSGQALVVTLVLAGTLLLIALFLALVVQRLLASTFAAFTRRREVALTPLVHRVLAGTLPRVELEAQLRPFDRRVVRELLLRLALDLRGEELERIGRLFGALGLLATERARLRHGSRRRRTAAAESLGLLRLRESVPSLVEALDDRDPRVRAAAIRGIGEAGDHHALAALPRMLGDPNPQVARRAEEVLIQRGGELLPEILAYLRSTSSRAGRRTAVDLLRWLRPPEAIELTLVLLDDPDPEIRIRATKAAGAIGDPRFLEPLHARLDEARWEVRAQAAKALGGLGSSASLKPLRARLADGSWWVRFHAAGALLDLGRDGHAALQEALGDPRPEVRDMARYLLTRRALGAVTP